MSLDFGVIVSINAGPFMPGLAHIDPPGEDLGHWSVTAMGIQAFHYRTVIGQKVVVGFRTRNGPIFIGDALAARIDFPDDDKDPIKLTLIGDGELEIQSLEEEVAL